MAAQQSAVEQGPLDKIIGMRVLRVLIAHLRGKTPAPHLQAQGQRGRLQPSLFQTGLELAVVRFGHCGQLRLEIGPQRAGRAQVAVAQLQALVTRPQRQRPRSGPHVQHHPKLPRVL